MIRVLLVDDEPGICQLLTRLIDWEGLNMGCVGTAGDGLTAQRMIQQLEPDVVVTDIQIPGMTGLELIESTISKENAPKFVVVSGFREFEYAHKALRFGVEDYLLKPIDQQELNGVLHRMAARIRNERKDDEMQKRAEDVLQERTQILRKNEIRKLCNGFVSGKFGAFNGDFFKFNEEDSLFCIASIRVQLSEINKDTVEVAKKILNNISNYIRIQNYRFGNRFKVVREIEDIGDLYENYYIPVLTLQPIVENAIHHGLEKRVGQGTVYLRSFLTQDMLIIQVEDNGVGMNEETLRAVREKIHNHEERDRGQKQISGNGIALINVHQRIQLYFLATSIKYKYMG